MLISRSATVRQHAYCGLILPLVVAAALLSGVVPCLAAPPSGVEVHIELPQGIVQKPISGRLYLYLSQHPFGQPIQIFDWFKPEPFFSLRVDGFAPGEARSIDDSATGFPEKLSKLPPGRYRAQAILDHDFYNPAAIDGVGNVYSDVAVLEIGTDKSLTLQLTNLVAARPFPKLKWIEEITQKSDLLSKFHKREVIERCTVVLPPSYFDHPKRRYPTIFIIPSFGGDHIDELRNAYRPVRAVEEENEAILVYLNARTKWGHHVYADSVTNGPRGRSLVQELIPLIDRQFRTVNAPTARFLMGHSSGGWSSLWLQVTYPETFGGVWSCAPDPVDFRDFQGVDLYATPPQNMYVDAQNKRRPIARADGEPILFFDLFTRMDDTLDRGGQLRSFEAVFSPLDQHGQPARLWDRKTGRVNTDVATAWSRYDIRLKLQRDWPRLKPLLAGKIHIRMGEQDTFYLDGSTKRLAEELKALGSDAVVEMIPGADHTSVLSPEYVRRCRQEISEVFKRHHGAE